MLLLLQIEKTIYVDMCVFYGFLYAHVAEYEFPRVKVHQILYAEL
jgi:hypothetical protein